MTTLLRVRSVTDNGQAFQLGIKQGDFIKSYDHTPIHTNRDFSEAIQRALGKPSVSITLIRESIETKVEAVPGPLGIDCLEIDPESTVEKVLERTDYGVTKSICGFVTYYGWALVALGAILVLLAFIEDAQLGLLGIPTGVGLASGGLLLILVAQVTRAIVDTADYSREILQTLRKAQAK